MRTKALPSTGQGLWHLDVPGSSETENRTPEGPPPYTGLRAEAQLTLDMNKWVRLPLLFGGGDAGPSISFLPGIISHLFSLQLLFSQGTTKALKQRSICMWSWHPAARARREGRTAKTPVFCL